MGSLGCQDLAPEKQLPLLLVFVVVAFALAVFVVVDVEALQCPGCHLLR